MNYLHLILIIFTHAYSIGAYYVPANGDDWTLLKPQCSKVKGWYDTLPFPFGIVVNPYKVNEDGELTEPEVSSIKRTITTSFVTSITTKAPKPTITSDIAVQIKDGQVQKYNEELRKREVQEQTLENMQTGKEQQVHSHGKKTKKLLKKLKKGMKKGETTKDESQDVDDKDDKYDQYDGRKEYDDDKYDYYDGRKDDKHDKEYDDEYERDHKYEEDKHDDKYKNDHKYDDQKDDDYKDDDHKHHDDSDDKHHDSDDKHHDSDHKDHDSKHKDHDSDYKYHDDDGYNKKHKYYDEDFVSPVYSVACYTNATLKMTLHDSILTDSDNRIGCIVQGHQWQFDGPTPQHGAVYAAGWSVTEQGQLALGNCTKFYQCASGNFYNLYDEPIGYQCHPVTLDVVELIEC